MWNKLASALKILFLFIPFYSFFNAYSLLAQGFKLPYKSGVKVTCTQGIRGTHSHKVGKIEEYAYDLSGTGELVACKSGTVTKIVDSQPSSSNQNSCYSASTCICSPNYILIQHDDGTKMAYLHIPNSSATVQVGNYVRQGEIIAEQQGQSGCATGPHVHLHYTTTGTSVQYYQQSQYFYFDDVSASGGQPIAGGTYTSQNTSTLQLNQNLSIHAGTVGKPKEMDIYFDENGYSGVFDQTKISNFKVGDFVIPTNRILSSDQVRIGNRLWRYMTVQLDPKDIKGLVNSYDSYPISFDYNSNGQKQTYRNNNLYFTDFDDRNTTFTDINDLATWSELYIRRGGKMGLFRGSSLTTFRPTNTLTRGEAAKVLVNAAIRLRLINMETSGDIYGDVSPSHVFFKEIQTMRYYGFAAANANFEPSKNITVGEFCLFMKKVFGITDNDFAPVAYINALKRKIKPTHPNAAILDGMESILKLVDIRQEIGGFWRAENVWDFKNYGQLVKPEEGSIIVDGTDEISRAVMAKVLTNIVLWKSSKLKINVRKKEDAPDISDMAGIGEKYDNTSTPSGSAPPQPNQVNFSCASGGSIPIFFKSDYDNSGNPQHFYWSMQKKGANITSNSPTHRSITFTAPPVSTPTEWKLYAYVANNKGKFSETVVTIKVGGEAGTTSAPPTQQAHSLEVYNPTESSLNVSWSRGNGQYCLVTCYEAQSNAQDVPDLNVIYNANSNFNNAPTIFNGSSTKVVYTGTGTSCNITGLLPNTQYQIAVFEYNGNTANTVQYQTSGAPLKIERTLRPVSQQTIADFTWNTNQINIGQTILFTNTSQNANSFQWSVVPNTVTISNPTSSGTTNITFPNTAGNYTIYLTATNTSTGASNRRAKTTYVSDPNEAFPDLKIISASPTTAVQNNTPFTMNLIERNEGNDYEAHYDNLVRFYLSNDNILDRSIDYNLGGEILVSSIPAHSQVDLSTTLNIPTAYGTGNYYILVVADDANYIQNEVSETNNVFVLPIEVIESPCDLVIQSITLGSSSIEAGTNLSISTTIKNIGNGTSAPYGIPYGFYLSKNEIIDNLDLFYSYIPMSRLSPNEKNTATNNFLIPNTLANGTYYLIGLLDDSNANVESNEANNTFIGGQITVKNSGSPTVSANNFTITNITDNSITLNWQNGNGSSRIAVASKTFVPLLPNDNTTYSPNSDYELAPKLATLRNGTGFSRAVYTGTGNSITMSNLTSSYDYYFTVIEQNEGHNYLQSFGLSDPNYNSDFKLNKAQVFAHTNFKPVTIDAWQKIENRGFNQSGNLNTNNPLFVLNSQIAYKVMDSYVERTLDGGKTWFSRQVLSNPQSLYGVNLSSVFFANSTTGWVAGSGGFIAKTTDGGDTWITQNSNITDRINDLHFIDNKIGYIVCNNYATNSKGDIVVNSGKVLKTIDGGTTWITVLNTNESLYAITGVSANEIWVSGRNGIVRRTINGGDSWIDCSVDSGFRPYFDFFNIKFLNSNVGYVAALYENINGQILKTVFKTVNGGETWNRLVLETGNTGRSVVSFDFINQDLGYVLMSDSKIFKTIDGGNSWTTMQFPFSLDGFGRIVCVNSNEIWLGDAGSTFSDGTYYKGGLFKTTTGGEIAKIDIENLNTNYCAGNTAILPYITTGTYGSSNSFGVQLSDNSGGFGTPTILSNFTNIGKSDIEFNLPKNLSQGSNYRIRVVSDNPVLVSDTTAFFTINAAPNVGVSMTPISELVLCKGQTSTTFRASVTNGGTRPRYQWYQNGAKVGKDTFFYSTANLKTDDAVWVEVVSNASCAVQQPTISPITTVRVVAIDTPYIQAIDNTLATSATENIQWFLNGTAISGATSQFYEATKSGFYTVRTTQGNCSVTSPIFSHTLVTANNDLNDVSNTIKVYPNPNNGTFMISSEATDLQDAQMTIFTTQGQAIFSKTIQQQNSEMNIGTLPTGVYYIKINTKQGKISQHKLSIVQ